MNPTLVKVKKNYTHNASVSLFPICKTEIIILPLLVKCI